MASAMTSKGQVTVPKAVRDLLGLEPGSLVEFERTADGQVVLRRADGPSPSRFRRVRGRYDVKLTTDELMALTRGED